jgi:4-amino-4-deoxy-L-arabinose transferase-like glycosyltransferase
VRGTPRELAALLGVAAILALAWAIVLPPFQGPDEITHVNYVQQLAETGEGPRYDAGGKSVSTEMAAALEILQLRSIVGLRDARPSFTEAEKALWREAIDGMGDAERSDGIGPSPLARNPQLYYAVEAVPYLALERADLLDRLVAMRLVNVLLFVLTVGLTWLLARELFGPARRLEVVLATGVVAVWPMLGFMGGVVNPDTGLTTAYTLTTWLAVRLLRRGPSLGAVVGLCLAGAATMLVHGRGAPAAAIVLVALAVAFVRTARVRRRLVAWSAAGIALATIPIVLARVALPSSGDGLYGGEVYLGKAFNLKQLVGQTWQFYFDQLSFMAPKLGADYGYRQVVVERWVTGVFAGLEVLFPLWVYDLVQYGIVAVLLALWTAAVLNRPQLRRAWPYLAVFATSVVAQLALLHTASYRALTGGPDPLITGRYLLPLTPIAALALAWLVGRLPRRARGYAAGGLLGLLLLLSLSGLGLTALRFHV